MKPIKLVMNAFGPYKEQVKIEFEKFGNNGLFLITGDTGSGKTTIFDAISFALFGISSGSRRENNSLRSDFASDNDKTFVELEFSHKGVFYKVERIPKYIRNKVRGNGVTSVGGEATLCYLGNIITGDKNVSDKCVEILGINANQFKQIMMIAQGEFMDLLLAKPKDRAVIFRKIFDTGIYKDISDKLKDKYLLKRREYEDIIVTLDSYKNNIIWDREVDNNITIEKLLELLNEFNVELGKEEEGLSLENEKIEKEYKEVVKKINEAALINDSIVTLDNSKIELNKLIVSKDLYDEKELILNKNKEIINYIIPKSNEVKKIRKSIIEKEKDYNENLRLKVECDEEYKKWELKYKEVPNLEIELKKFNEEMRNIKGGLESWKEKEKIEIRIKGLKNLICLIDLEEKKKCLNKFNDLDSFIKELEEKEHEFEELSLKYEKDNNFYVSSYEEFLRSQAGILALDLEDNMPCPVCGSVDHPKKAVIKKEVLSKEELDNLKILLEETSKKQEDLVIIIRELKNKINDYDVELKDYDYEKLVNDITLLKEKLRDVIIDVNPSEYNKFDVEREIIGWEEFIKDTFSDVINYKSQKEFIDKINKLQIKIEMSEFNIEDIVYNYQNVCMEREKYNTIVEGLKKELDKLNGEYSICNDEYILSYKSLGYNNEDEYLSVMLDKDLISKMEKDVSEYKIKLVEINSTIKSLEKFLKGKEKINIEDLEIKRNKLEDEKSKKNVSLKELDRKLFNNISIYNNIKNVFDKSIILEKEVMLYKDLSDTANGNINGKNKLEFEQYVQANYFDMVVVSANKRFSYMTDERYLLTRKEEAVKISDKLGLELEVIDNYTGKRRDIRTLSGGESFKAALSLALGMSDVIQEFAGGIVVDAMFIDEGFGSLDDTSLNQAMNAIMMLGQGDKLIGIISHVNELKTRIDKKIVVRKSNVGSSVEVVI